jgi:hypothetical protein
MTNSRQYLSTLPPARQQRLRSAGSWVIDGSEEEQVPLIAVAWRGVAEVVPCRLAANGAGDPGGSGVRGSLVRRPLRCPVDAVQRRRYLGLCRSPRRPERR